MKRFAFVLLLVSGTAAAQLPSSLTVPIVLTSTGIAGSFYTSELTLTNRGTGTVTLGLTYSAAFGGGSGAATDTLAPGRQKIVPNAIDYLIGRGVPIPKEGNRGGTLRIDFSGPSGEVAATVRTTTAVEGGRAGLCYSGIAGGLSEPAYLCGLTQSGNDRSNVAVLNAGGPGDGSIALRLTVVSHEPGAPPSQALPDVTLSPGEFRQFSEVLADLGLKSGHVRVERVSGAAPYFCYATVMNQETSDGSFVEPIGESALAGRAGLTLPVVVESPAYSTELVLTNLSTSFKPLNLSFVASAIQAPDSAASITVVLDPGEQRTIPSFVQLLRDRGAPGVGSAGPTFAGALFLTSADGATVSGVAVGARTSTPAGTGRYGLFYGAVPYGGAATASAWLYGLQQDGENRANLAVVNTGEADASTDVFAVDLFDGGTGAKASSFTITLEARRWTQVNGVLAQYAPGVKHGYARVTRVSGSNPFLAYGVLNDGGQPGERSGDGAFLPAALDSAGGPGPPQSTIAMMESTDLGKTWTFKGYASFHAPSLLPVDPSALYDNGELVLYVFDLASLMPEKTCTVYRATAVDGSGLDFTAPVNTYQLTSPRFTDPNVIKLPDGRYRLYLHTDDVGVLSATGTDGRTFTADPGVRTLAGGLPGAVVLPDGRVRMYVSTSEGISSVISSDGLAFSPEPGVRITPGGSAHPIRSADGRYRMTYCVRPGGAAGDVKDDEVYYAESTDGLSWTSGASALYKGSVPTLVELPDGRLRLYFPTFESSTPSCTYTVTPTSKTFTASGGTGSVSVTAGSTCAWTAASDSAWLTITSGTPGTGNGTVAYAVSANTGSARTGKLTVAGQTVTVSQSAPGGTFPESSTWLRLGGPPGGLGYDIRMRPDNPDVMFVTDGYAGIHRSTDGGKSWTAVNKGMEACTWCGASVFCATIDPHDNDTIWTGTQFTGHIYRSTDNGDSWVQRDTGLTFTDEQRSLRGLTVDPKDPNTVYAGLEVRLTQWSDGTPTTTPRGRWGFPGAGEVYKSTDAGALWTRVWKGESLARYIWVDPRNTKRVYVSTGIFDRDASNSDVPNGVNGGVGILRSDDAGATWTVLDERQGLGGRYIPSLFMHPTNPDVLIAAVTLPAQAGGVYVTRNGGDTWTMVLAAPPNNGIEAVEISTKDTNVWYAGNEGFAYRSDDAGVTWQRYAVGSPDRPKSGVPIDLQADPRNAMRIFVNNYGGGNFLSEDGGATWSDASKGYTGAAVSVVAVEPGDGKTVWAGSRSTDGGATWSSSTAPPYASMALRKGTDGALHLWVGDGNGKVHRSTDGGSTWQAAVVAPDIPPATTQALAVGPSDARVVYSAFGTGNCLTAFNACYVSQKGMHRSTDGGASWQPLTGATFADVSVMSFAIHPTDARTVYASGGHSLHRSSDGGATWQGFPAFEAEVAKYVTNNDVYQIEQGGKPITYDVVLDPFDPRIVTTACLPGVLMRSTDEGVTWRQIAAGMDANEPVIDLLVDPVHEGVIYAASTLSGVFVSKDRGLSWRKLDSAFAVPTPAVLALSENGEVLYAGSAVNTRGAGVFRLGTP